MSLDSLGNVAVGFSRSMDATAMKLQAHPEIVQDPAALARFNIELFNAQSGYQLASRTIQTIHKEDDMLSEMLRDA